MVEIRVRESFQIYERNAGIMCDKLCKELEETGMRGKGWKGADSLGIASLSVGSCEGCRLPVKGMPVRAGSLLAAVQTVLYCSLS